jgi:hypothetical protein
MLFESPGNRKSGIYPVHEIFEASRHVTSPSSPMTMTDSVS